MYLIVKNVFHLCFSHLMPGRNVRPEAPRRSLCRRQHRHGASLLDHGGQRGQVGDQNSNNGNGSVCRVSAEKSDRREDEDLCSTVGQRHQGKYLSVLTYLLFKIFSFTKYKIPVC